MGVQRLRFKDEKENSYPEWSKQKIQDFMFIAKNIKAENIERNKILSVKLHKKGIYPSSNTTTLKLGSTSYYIRNKGQFIYGKQNLFNGAFGIIPSKYDGYLSSGDIPSLNFKKNKINILFFLNFFGRKVYYKNLEKLSSGTGSKRIHPKEFLNISIFIPKSLEEQEKIGKFLSLFDRLIEKIETKIGLLKELKKGYLQQMFPAKGESVPKIRFAGFDGDWKNQHLGEFLEHISERNSNNSITNVLSVNNKLGFIKQSEQFEDRVVASKDLSNYKIVRKNDFAYNPARINVGSIARLEKYELGIVSPMYIVFGIEGQIDLNYFNYFLKTKIFKDQMTKNLVGSVRQTLDFNSLMKIKLKASSLKEQEKIGNFFKNLDEVIEKHEKEMNAIEQLKKGYMQRLFA